MRIKENIFSVGALDRDRKTFDELVSLPDGTSYNSYLVVGSEKTALIDTVDPTKTDILIDNLKALKITKIDYLISHHGEQDHSGSIPKILELFPSAQVVTSQKCKDELKELVLIPEEKFMVIKDHDTLALGDKTLEFVFTPWVHWPETMCTYLREDKILFSCDFFGSHLATDELFAGDDPKVYIAVKRYFAEIMMPFRGIIKTNLEKLSTLEISMIAPSHGQIHDKPEKIISAYKEWASDDVKNEVVIPYVSMHGSVQVMVDYFVKKLSEKGIVAKPFNISKMDLGELAMELVDAATVVIGSPTVLSGPHPLAANVAFLANALRPKTKYISIIGSYLWGGKMVEMLAAMIPNLKVEVLEPVLVKGYPKEADFVLLDKLAEVIQARHKELKIL